MVAPDPQEKQPKLSRSLVRVPGSGSNSGAQPSTCDLGHVSSQAETVPINPNLPPFLTNRNNTVPIPQPTPVKVFKCPTGQELQVKYSEHNQSVSQRYTEACMDTKSTSSPRVTRKSSRYTSSPRRTCMNTRHTSSPALASKSPRYTRSRVRVPNTRSSSPAMLPSRPPQALGGRRVEISSDMLANRPGRLVMMPIRQVLEQRSTILHVSTEKGPLLLKPVIKEGVKTRSQGHRMRNGHQGVSGDQPSSILKVTTLQDMLNEQNNLVQETEGLQRQLETFRQMFRDPEKLKAVAKELGLKINQKN